MRLQLWTASGAPDGHISARDGRRLEQSGCAYPIRDEKRRLIGFKRKLGQRVTFSPACITVAETEAAMDGSVNARDKIIHWRRLQLQTLASLVVAAG